MLNKSDCPDIEDGYEPILAWANAKVSWSDIVYSGRDLTPIHRPDLASWGFSWKHGGISFSSSLKKDEEKMARMASAMTIYLWCKGINMSLAWKLGLASSTPSYFEF